MGLAEDVIRMSAERDGWREIACRLLRMAMGDDCDQFEIPPIELIADPKRIESTRPLLKQWWADLTRLHAEIRSVGGVPAGPETNVSPLGRVVAQAARDVRAGQVVCIGRDGLLYPADEVKP
jgi:hypothetical protein